MLTLNQAVALVAPHMGKDKALPILNVIRVQNGTLAASDRYTMARAYVGQPTDVPEATYDGDPFDAPAWTLDTASDGYLTPEDVKAKPVKIRANTITFANGSTKPLQTENPASTDYPPLEKLIDGFTPLVPAESTDEPANEPTNEPTNTPYGTLSFNPEYLARFAVTVPGAAYPAGYETFSRRHRNEKPTVTITLPLLNFSMVKVTLGSFTEAEYVGLIIPLRKTV